LGKGFFGLLSLGGEYSLCRAGLKKSVRKMIVWASQFGGKIFRRPCRLDGGLGKGLFGHLSLVEREKFVHKCKK
jgi:hypothetical protein